MAGTDYQSWQGLTVYSNDNEKIGKIADLYDDESGGQPIFATVQTGMFGTGTSFVPLKDAQMSGDSVNVPFSKETVKNAPRVEADAELSDEEVNEVFRYYGLDSSGSLGAGASSSAGTSTSTSAGAAGTAATAGTRSGTTGHDTSGPSTDDAMTRSEERLRVGTQQVEAGKARLRKYVTTETVTQTVPVSHEEVRIEREPITEANMPAATDGPAISEEEHEVVLHAEQAVVQKETVPVERVRLGTETVTEQQQVTEQVRKEQIETEGVDAYPADSSSQERTNQQR